MAHNPKSNSIFNAILPFLAKHKPQLLHEIPIELTYEELVTHVCKELQHSEPVSWIETSDLIGKIVNGK